MTKAETAQVIAVLQVNYPDNFRGKSEAILDATVNLWHGVFERDPYSVVHAAVMAYMQTSTDRFMPNVGIIREQIRKLTEPDGMSEAEAWGLVKNALRNGLYGYHEEYAKLPPIVQRCVGSENTIREWATMGTDELDSVVASNFQRSFRAISKSEEEWAKLPPGFRDEMKRLSGQMFGRLEAGGEGADSSAALGMTTAGRSPMLHGGTYG